MQHHPRTLSLPVGRLSPVYLVAWALLAALALAYLALLVVRPEIAEGLFLKAPPGSPEDNRGQRAMARLLVEVRELRQAMAGLERELGEVRQSVAAGEHVHEKLTLRVTAVESGLKAVIGPHSQLASVPETPAPTKGSMVRGFAEERPTVPARDGAKLATGAASPPRAAQAAAPLAVQLASGPSLDALRLSWQLLQEHHKVVLKTLEPRFEENAADPPQYRLLAGPLATDTDAEKLCERLRGRKVTCSVTPFAGKPL